MQIQYVTPSKQFIKLPIVCNKTAKSRSAIYKAIKDGKFPKPYANGSRSVAWLANEIDSWIDAQTAKVGA